MKLIHLLCRDINHSSMKELREECMLYNTVINRNKECCNTAIDLCIMPIKALLIKH
nr:MAG TPA: hypothetical protein [Bacteriophage sp.]